jgi:hypothetical protein
MILQNEEKKNATLINKQQILAYTRQTMEFLEDFNAIPIDKTLATYLLPLVKKYLNDLESIYILYEDSEAKNEDIEKLYCAKRLLQNFEAKLVVSLTQSEIDQNFKDNLVIFVIVSIIILMLPFLWF